MLQLLKNNDVATETLKATMCHGRFELESPFDG